jgi:hypothetical protein
VIIVPVALKSSVAGSYSSAEASVPLGPMPPATSTCPLGRSITVWARRGVVIDPVFVKVPGISAYAADASDRQIASNAGGKLHPIHSSIWSKQ